MPPRVNKTQQAIDSMEAESAAVSDIVSDAVCDAALAKLGQPPMSLTRDWIRPALAAAFHQKRLEKLGDKAAKDALLSHMLWWSESHYAAGWLIDLELTMARYAAEDPDNEFRWLVGQAGGWWTFNDDWKVGDGYDKTYLWVPGTFEELVTSRRVSVL